MSVYVDDIHPTVPLQAPKHTWPYKEACHMWADSEAELDDLARRIGLKVEWKQRNILVITQAEFVHYDLTRGKRAQARAAGAVPGNLKAWLKGLR